MSTEYRPAPEVAKIAEGLIAKVHTRLVDLRIEFLFRDKAATSNGRTILGKAKKVTGLTAFLSRSVTSEVGVDPADDFFLIEIAEDEWARLGSAGRKALVDHELTHCAVEWNGDECKLSIRGHDVEEFGEVIQRNGLWNEGIAEFGGAIKEQLALFKQDAA